MSATALLYSSLHLFIACTLLPAAGSQGQVSSKVVGGAGAQASLYPYFVALVPFGRTTGTLDVLCGASLITQTHLLTAAHCFNGLQASQRANAFTPTFVLENRCEGKFSRQGRVSRVVVHPNYTPQTMRNDLAVMTLVEAISLTPVQLPPARPNMKGSATIIGYGNTKRRAGNYPCGLQQANVQLYTRQECLRTGNYMDIVNMPNVLCAGRSTGGVDTCDGDSGGPLLRQNEQGVFIQGITSFGNGCARQGFPGVYTDVSKYLRWIKTNTGQTTTTTTSRSSDNIFCLRNVQSLIQFFNLCSNSQNSILCDCEE